MDQRDDCRGSRHQESEAGRFGRRRRTLTLLLLSVWLASCGELRPLPDRFEPETYTLINYQDLLAPGPAGLLPGQRVQVRAFFWEFLTYDPDMIKNYLTLPRHPIDWYRLRWFAVYGSEDMRGYYDLAALSPEQASRYSLKRMDAVILYGEISRFTPGVFLRVHHLEKAGEF